MRVNSDAIYEAGQRSQTPIQLEDEAEPFHIVGARSISLEKHLPRPVRARGAYKADSLEDLVRFCANQQSPHFNVIGFWRHVAFGWGRLTVLLNFHTSPEIAGWCDLRAVCWCRFPDGELLSFPVLRGKYQPFTQAI